MARRYLAPRRSWTTSGAVWTMSASGAILRNGLSAAGGRGSTILWTAHTNYVLWTATGGGGPDSGWAYVSTQPPGGYTSPDGATIPGATQIVDNLGAVWTIHASGAILRNGLLAAGGILDRPSCWTNRAGYVLGTGNWWRWTGSGWAFIGDPTAGQQRFFQTARRFLAPRKSWTTSAQSGRLAQTAPSFAMASRRRADGDRQSCGRTARFTCLGPAGGFGGSGRDSGRPTLDLPR